MGAVDRLCQAGMSRPPAEGREQDRGRADALGGLSLVTTGSRGRRLRDREPNGVLSTVVRGNSCPHVLYRSRGAPSIRTFPCAGAWANTVMVCRH
ncbi:MAG: hypothetical protein RL345_1132 [Chloroflexota bacterium]